MDIGYQLTIFDLPARAEKLNLYNNLPFIRSHRDHFKCLQGDILHSGLPEASYDLLTCVSVIEHIENDIRAFQNMIRLLKTGGVAILTFPISGKYLEWRSSDYYLTLSKSYSPRSLGERWLDASPDIEVMEKEYYYYDDQYRVPGNGWTNFTNSFNCFKRVNEDYVNHHLPQAELTDACEPFFQTTCILTVKKINT